MSPKYWLQNVSQALVHPKNNVTKQDEKVSPILDPPLPSDSLLPTEREETRLPSILKSKKLLCLDFLWKLLLDGKESNSILQLPTPNTSSSILCFGSGFCFGFSLHFGFWTCSLPVLKPLQLLGSLWKSMVRWSLLVLFGPWWFFLVLGGPHRTPASAGQAAALWGQSATEGRPHLPDLQPPDNHTNPLRV